MVTNLEIKYKTIEIINQIIKPQNYWDYKCLNLVILYKINKLYFKFILTNLVYNRLKENA